MSNASILKLSTIKQAIAVAALSLTMLAPASVAADQSEDAIRDRIKPVGNVYLAADLEGIAPATAAADAAPGEPRDGATVYNTACSACHNTGAAGAPKKGDAAAWEPRIAQGDETLLSHAINGFNLMPAKGGCADCTDDEIAAAIEFMLEGL